MKTQFFFPAPVEVVKVTNENLADVAAWCGGKVASTESRRVPGRQDSYVWVPTPKGNSISWAFPGMYITKRLVVTVKDEMKETFAVFRRDYFSRNYFDTPTEATDKTWEKQFKKDNPSSAPKPAAPKPRPSYKSKAEIEADQKEPNMEEENVNVNIEGVAKFRHQHSSKDACDVWECITDPTIPGVHIFTDIRFKVEAPAETETPVVEDDTTKEEEDMELNENAVPEITEDEAKAIEADQEAGIELPANPQEAQYTPVEPGSDPADMPTEEPVVETEESSNEQKVEDTDLVADDIKSGGAVTETPILTEESPFSKAGDAEKLNVVKSHGSDGFNAGTLD